MARLHPIGMPNAVLAPRHEYHLPGTAARAARLPPMAEARLEQRVLRLGLSLSHPILAITYLIVPNCSFSPESLKLLKRGLENASRGSRPTPLLASTCA